MGVAKKGVALDESVGVVDVVGGAGLEPEAAAAAAAWRLARLLCRKSGTPENARRFDASLSAASWRFHLFRRF